MIYTEKTAINKQSSVEKSSSFSSKRKLRASWQKVDGKLVCQWIKL
ncbi:hypothetical protein [Myxosarcina sp. GI1(2024)]